MKIFYLSDTLYTKGETDEAKCSELIPMLPYFHLDDASISLDMHLWYGSSDATKRANDEIALIAEVKRSQPDMFLYKSTWKDVSDNFFHQISGLNIPIVTIFADTLSVPPASEIRLVQRSDYIIIYDSVTNYFRYRFLYETLRPTTRAGAIFAGGNQFCTDEFKKLDIPQIYDVSMIGSLEGIRKDMIEFLSAQLAKQGINFHSKGGLINFNPNKPADSLSDDFLSLDKYVEAINKSKINIVSQTRPERSQVKCKIFEYMLCGGFCLIDQNIEYELMLPPDVAVYYTSYEDCLEKIIYYFHHEEERIKIAEKAYEWCKQHFHYKTFWRDCFKAIYHKSNVLPCLPTLNTVYEKLCSQVNFTDNTLAEIKRLIYLTAPHNTQDNTVKHPLVTTASSSSNNTLSNLRDPLSTGFWQSELGWPQWLIFDYGQPARFNVVHVHNVLINNAIHLKDFSIEASIDLNQWTTLLTAKMKNFDILQIFNFDNHNAFRFYRLTGYSNYHDGEKMLLANVIFLSSVLSPMMNHSSTLDQLIHEYDETLEKTNRLLANKHLNRIQRNAIYQSRIAQLIRLSIRLIKDKQFNNMLRTVKRSVLCTGIFTSLVSLNKLVFRKVLRSIK